MKYDNEPGREEDIFRLVRRGLKEELGLDPEDYGKIIVTWLGWSEHAAGFAGIGIVRTNLPEAEVDQRRSGCHSIYEHDLSAWLSMNRKNLVKLMARQGAPDGSSPWIAHTPLIASELWRCKDQI